LPPLLQPGPQRRPLTIGTIQRNAKKDYTNPMPTRFPLRLAEIFVTATLAAIVLSAWRADRRDRAQLAADLATGRQALAQADARQHDRDAQLLQTLAALTAEKRTVTTPAQIIRDLPQQIPLPAPITLKSTNPEADSGKDPCSSGPNCGPEGLGSKRPGNHEASNAAETQAVVPAADLKPLYDFSLDCRACQAKLAAAQADLADERAKTTVLTHERDEAVRATKGGSILRRIARNAKWLAIGAAAGAIAAKSHR
jgi:type II secretory pathway pseudopilin PulG